jgi:hypothetical protein
VELGACDKPVPNSHTAKVYLDVVVYKGSHEENGSEELLRFASPELLPLKTRLSIVLTPALMQGNKKQGF